MIDEQQAKAIAEWWAFRLEATAAQKRAFGDALTSSILANQPHELCVDYTAEAELSEALDAAGVRDWAHCPALPQKTYMRLDCDPVLVSEGYGAPWEPMTAGSLLEDNPSPALARTRFHRP